MWRQSQLLFNRGDKVRSHRGNQGSPLREVTMNTTRIIAIVALVGFGFVANAQAYEATAEQRAACTGDAFRFCGSSIPNVEAVTACMIANKSKLSAACQAAFPKHEAKR
jgi:hypothetical protein